MIEEFFSCLHVVIGILKTIHNVIRYNYTYSYTNNSIFIHKLVSILFCQFLENDNRYKVENFGKKLSF